MDGDFWLRMAGLLALVLGLFVFPVVTLWRDERKATRERLEHEERQNRHAVKQS